jgi:hypothetical protein
LDSRRIISVMAQSFGNQFTLVEVTTDSSVRGIPKRQLWVAAARPDQAVTLVLCANPVGWTASVATESLTPEQEAILNLKPGRRAVLILCHTLSRLANPETAEVAMSDQEFLLYPLDTGEDPVCLGCGALLTVVSHEARETKPDFITFRCTHCGRSEL